MRFCAFVIFFSQLLFSCSFRGKGDSNSPVQFDSLSIPASDTEFYFPLKGLGDYSTMNAVDTFRNTWFSHFLFQMKEPILFSYDGDMEIYRFTWLRSFNAPVVLRLEKLNDSVRLISRMSNGAGGYYAGDLILDTVSSLSHEKYEMLSQEIENAHFWSMPTDMKRSGCDGAEWIIEGYKDGDYHLVYRWSPEKETKPNFRSIGELLIGYCELPSDTSDLY